MPNDESIPVAKATRRARAATSNASGRFEAHTRIAIDDGWAKDDEDPSPIKTTYYADTSRTVIARNKSPDVSFDRSLNPYRGCEHGCIYCFARPTHAYLGLSPGLDFETQIMVKPDAAELLKAELSKPGYRPDVMAIGTNTDPYQPAEKSLKLMVCILDVLRDFQHPVSVVTKGALIRRDVGVLAEMAAVGLAKAGISITTLDTKLCRALEPRAASPVQRLKSIECLAKAGIPVRVMVAPVIPGLTDHEIEAILKSAADAGAEMASNIALRLPLEVAPLFEDWLEENRPLRAAKVLGRMREMHGGKLYDATFGQRMRGKGVQADLISNRFKLACKRYGLRTGGRTLRCDLFKVPGRATQLSLF